ncbi:Isoquinoline 1-oxidoreductase subunit [Sphingomonas sp. DT-204]|uniref:Isoquinoline 1-oxidoreductase subunit n=1 Tax=Sphingomonas sp. DT-204 TaxID=3396166 RepID=UPI003F1CEEC6
MKLRLPRPGCLSVAALLVAAIIFAAAILLRPQPLPQPQPLPTDNARNEIARLRPVAAFATIADPQTRSVALFQEAGRVIQHPRCLNCHPRTDRPTQTDAMRPHMPAVTRGPNGEGDPTLRCSTCHHAANFERSGVPGNPKWRTAPIEQAWQGKTLGEICRQMLDPARSHMSRAELLHHIAHDELVGWAWHPGGDRARAPGTQAEFGALIGAWLDTGAQCPA